MEDAIRASEPGYQAATAAVARIGAPGAGQIVPPCSVTANRNLPLAVNTAWRQAPRMGQKEPARSILDLYPMRGRRSEVRATKD
jgi:hypothetical protein